MRAALQDLFGAAQDRLCRNVQCVRLCHAVFHACACERIDEHIAVCRRAARKDPEQREHAFRKRHDLAERPAHGFGKRTLLIRHTRAAAIGAHGGADGGVDVGHYADHRRIIAQKAFDVVDRLACGNGNNQRVTLF